MDLSHIRSFYEYDQDYTAPMHGFEDHFDYWQKASAKKFLEKINIPTLIINSLDDPFLGPECYPFQEQSHNTNLRLITPDFGGHLGFMELSIDRIQGLKINFLYEKYILEFL
jgi:predicted alpha/beta-fold hydrolase